MLIPRSLACALLAASLCCPAYAAATKKPVSLTTAEVIEQSTASDWQPLDPENTLVMQLPSGRVVMVLAPDFAPRHVANIKALAREHYYDGLAIVRAQENYVAQWGDPDSEDAAKRKPITTAARTLPAEFSRVWSKTLPFTGLPDGDVYAPRVGFSGAFPAAGKGLGKQVWLAHCNGMVGAGRDLAEDSGGGTELYAVIGHAPRHLDRNVTLVGRVVQGIERLSTLPRGTGPLGFYEQPEQRTAIVSVRLAADLPAAERPALESLRTDTRTFRAYVESRRFRREDWFLEPTGHVELCNVAIPVRAQAAAITPKP